MIMNNRKLIGVEYVNPINFVISNEPPPFFELACDIGKNSDYTYKLGAVIYHKKRLICDGWNQCKTHPHQAAFRNRSSRLFLHAEIHAIVRAKRDLEGCSMTIARMHRHTDTLGSSRSCAGCRAAIIEAGIKKINYHNGETFVTEYL